MKNYKLIQPDERKWEPHPQVPRVEISYFLSKRADQVDMTGALVHLPVGAQVEKHLHENSDDIIYVLQGKAKMWVDGIGNVPLVSGTFLRIPKGTMHQPLDVEEDFIAYDIWYPALV